MTKPKIASTIVSQKSCNAALTEMPSSITIFRTMHKAYPHSRRSVIRPRIIHPQRIDNLRINGRRAFICVWVASHERPSTAALSGHRPSRRRRHARWLTGHNRLDQTKTVGLTSDDKKVVRAGSFPAFHVASQDFNFVAVGRD